MSSKRTIGIRSIYDEGDSRLTEKVEIPIAYADKRGEVRHKTVRVTLAEKWVIESIAMRLFADHKKVVHKERMRETGKVGVSAWVTIADKPE